MDLKRVVEICDVRQSYNLPCKDCEIPKTVCEHAQKILKVKKPCEYITK